MISPRLPVSQVFPHSSSPQELPFPSHPSVLSFPNIVFLAPCSDAMLQKAFYVPASRLASSDEEDVPLSTPLRKYGDVFLVKLVRRKMTVWADLRVCPWPCNSGRKRRTSRCTYGHPVVLSLGTRKNSLSCLCHGVLGSFWEGTNHPLRGARVSDI